jgi:hypothetical protein
MDADGFDDVAVGAPGYSNTGEVMVFRGSAGRLLAGTALTHSVPFSQGFLGRALAPGGDMDGDGYADLIAGAPGDFSPGSRTVGHCVVYFGGPGALALNSRSTVIGTNFSVGGDGFGAAVASVGDIDGDGYLELCVGARRARRARDARFVLRLEHRPIEFVVWQMDGSRTRDWARRSRSSATRGRRLPRVGGRCARQPGHRRGERPRRARALRHLDEHVSHGVFYGQETARLGASLSGAGDVDGDGYSS